jgi:nucleoid-associated protein YejK
MAIRVRNAILHILKPGGLPSVFSDMELDIDSEICEAFIQTHVKKLINNPAARKAQFKPEAELYSVLGDYQNGNITFKEASLAFAKKMDSIMQKYDSIPPCDMLITRVSYRSKGTHCEYIAVLLLHYKEVYSHKTVGTDNQLKTCDVLPSNSSSIKCAALIALEGSMLPTALIEKREVIDGNLVRYFSELFLDCETTPSEIEQAILIREATAEIVDEYFNNDPIVAARIKAAILGEYDKADSGVISFDNIAEKALDAEMKPLYVNALREAGVREDIPLGERVAKQQFSMHRIKTENGVEIRFPVEYSAINNDLDITPQSDGTVSALFKNLRFV